MKTFLLTLAILIVPTFCFAGQSVLVPTPAEAPAPVAQAEPCCQPTVAVATVQAPVVQYQMVVPQVQYQYVQAQAVAVQAQPVCAQPVCTQAVPAAPVQTLETKLTFRQRRELRKQNREARFHAVAAVPAQTAVIQQNYATPPVLGEEL